MQWFLTEVVRSLSGPFGFLKGMVDSKGLKDLKQF